MLQLRLFGTGQASFCDRPLMGFPYQQSYLLLCYLLLNRDRPHNRERLAAVFWGEYSTNASRKYLRNVLWRLRHAFQSVGASADEYVLVSDDSASFSTTSRYWLDVEVLESTIARYRDVSGQDLTPDQAAELEQAVALYAGDLLEGIYDDWCLHDRERLSLLHLNSLSKLMSFHEVNGAYERGLMYGQRILDRDETRDKVHRQMMRLYLLMGDRNAALEQYRRCEQILRETLGIIPVEETRRLYQNILHNQSEPKTPSNVSDTVPSPQATSDRFSHSTAAYLLDKLRHLHTMIEDTSFELHQIEHFIGNSLSNADHS